MNKSSILNSTWKIKSWKTNRKTSLPKEGSIARINYICQDFNQDDAADEEANCMDVDEFSDNDDKSHSK